MLEFDTNISQKQLKKQLRVCNTEDYRAVTVRDNHELKKLTKDLFPDWFVALDTLNVYSTQLQYVDEKSFRNLIGIKSLRLDRNQLDSLPDQVFVHCSQLQRLVLQRNRLRLNPIRALQPLDNLRQLDLSWNRLQYFCGLQFDALETLDLSHNRITCFCANRCGQLRSLNLSYNFVSELDPDSFDRARYLRELDCSSNRIAQLPPHLFRNHSDLRTVRFNYNLLTEFATGGWHPNLRLLELQLIGNRLRKLSFAGLSSLLTLHVTGNSQLAKIRDWQALEQLKQLFIARVIKVPSHLPVLVHFRGLRVLDMSHSYFKLAIPQHYFEPLVQLVTLRLNGSRSLHSLTYLTPLFSDANRLKQLALRDCSIRLLDDQCFRALVLLTQLDLSTNKIAFLHPKTFRRLARLRTLDLSHNKLSGFDACLFVNLINLESIDLSYNLFDRFCSDWFANCTRLDPINIDFSYNLVPKKQKKSSVKAGNASGLQGALKVSMARANRSY